MSTKSILFLLILISASNLFAQISFEKGYFINNSNDTIHCLIKNFDWKSNPTAIQFKINSNDNEKTKTINEIKEFSIVNSSKYIVANVDIDRSTDVLHLLSNERNPKFKKETIFLKVLEEGKASLYSYKDNSLTRFFFSKPDVAITQLVYKRYIVNVNDIKTNNYYKQQLLANLDSEKITEKKVKWTKYNTKSLRKLFSTYNESSNTFRISHQNKKRKGFLSFFNLNIRPRINNSSASITSESVLRNSRNSIFESMTNFGLGAEAEFILPFNKNKWSVIVEPTYLKYEANGQEYINPVSLLTEQAKISYTAIEIPVGIRHYIFLTKKLSLFLNIQVVLNSSPNSEIQFLNQNNNMQATTPLNIATNTNYTFGGGVKYRRFILELRHYTKRNLLNLGTWESEFKSNSLVLGYSLF